MGRRYEPELRKNEPEETPLHLQDIHLQDMERRGGTGGIEGTWERGNPPPVPPQEWFFFSTLLDYSNKKLLVLLVCFLSFLLFDKKKQEEEEEEDGFFLNHIWKQERGVRRNKFISASIWRPPLGVSEAEI